MAEDDDFVEVEYDDDDGEGIEPLLASLAAPIDPFTRAIATHAGWQRQITPAFVSADEEGKSIMVVQFPWEVKKGVPVASPTQVALIGEGLARLKLSDAAGDGVVCRFFKDAVDELTKAVKSAQERMEAMPADRKAFDKQLKAMRHERASGLFLPIWRQLDATLNVDAQMDDILRISQSQFQTYGEQALKKLGNVIRVDRTTHPELDDVQFLMKNLNATTMEANNNMINLFNFVSSNINLHMVYHKAMHSAMFGRANRQLHTNILQAFDRYDVVVEGMMQPGMKRREGLDTYNLVSVKKILVEIPITDNNFIDRKWIDQDRIDITYPENSGGGKQNIFMDGIEITIKQHNYAKKAVKREGKPKYLRTEEKKRKFKTGKHAVIHFRKYGTVVDEGTEDDRVDTLSFVYRWPDMLYATEEAQPVKVDQVKIILYGSGNVEWWKDYYRPVTPAEDDNTTIFPYPMRRQYVKEGDTIDEFVSVSGTETKEINVKTWIEYHDIHHLVHAQALYGVLADLKSAVEEVQKIFAELLSGAHQEIMMMSVVEAHEVLRSVKRKGEEVLFMRVDEKANELTDQQIAGVGKRVIRKLPRMRNVFRSQAMTPVWDNKNQPILGTRDILVRAKLPVGDLIEVLKKGAEGIYAPVESSPIVSRIQTPVDYRAITSGLFWWALSDLGRRNMALPMPNPTTAEAVQSEDFISWGEALMTREQMEEMIEEAYKQQGPPVPITLSQSPGVQASGYDPGKSPIQQGVSLQTTSSAAGEEKEEETEIFEAISPEEYEEFFKGSKEGD